MTHHTEHQRQAAALQALAAYRERFVNRLIDRFVWRLQAFSDRKAAWDLIMRDETGQELYASTVYGTTLLSRLAPHLQPVGWTARLGLTRQRLSDVDIDAAEQILRDTLNGRTFSADFPPRHFQDSPFSGIAKQLNVNPMAFFYNTSQGVGSLALDDVEKNLPDPTSDGWQRTWLVVASLIVAINNAEQLLSAKLNALENN